MDTPKPGDFPVGSVESRAAMRLQISNEKDAPTSERRVTFSVGEVVAYGPVKFGVGKIAEEFFAEKAQDEERANFQSVQESEREHTKARRFSGRQY